jgi:menaquinone-dependent protoporphyrinogen IX oxidase
MMRTLIVYGTRYGATASTTAEIAKVLRAGGMEVTIANAKEGKVKEVTRFDLIIVGSGMMIDKWTREAEAFLRRFQKDLANKRVALFVSSGAQALIEHDGNKELMGRSRTKYLDEKASEYGLHPIATGLFGGVWDFNRLPWWAKALPAAKQLMAENRRKLEAAGYKEAEPGVYDTRDWNVVRSWAGGLSKNSV